LHQVVLGGE
jgi:hypothetical protein